MRKLTQDEFISRAENIHEDKYDYSKVEYVNSRSKICIICPEHGEFWQEANSHLRGVGCPKCGKYIQSKKQTKDTELFIKHANELHNGKYDYSKVDYVNHNTKVCIICPMHGEFWQRPDQHLQGKGCSVCGCNYHYTSEEWIVKTKEIHNEKYDYSKVIYVNNKTPICIICPEHGEFWQTPNNHLNGQGCPKCANIQIRNKLRSSTEEFIAKSKNIHNNKYDYSKVEYVNNSTKVCIICPEHGEFWQRPNYHLQGCECPECAKIKLIKQLTHSTDVFIHNAQKIHGNKYDYSKTEYVRSHKKICVICPEHGPFWVRPSDHIKLKSGCPKCKASHMEIDIRIYLTERNIKFEEQKKFDWLGKQTLDFYLPDYKTAIECQGLQHFEPIGYFGSYESFIKIKNRDSIKQKLCVENGIKLLYYANYEYNFPYKVYTQKDELLKLVSEKQIQYER